MQSWSKNTANQRILSFAWLFFLASMVVVGVANLAFAA